MTLVRPQSKTEFDPSLHFPVSDLEKVMELYLQGGVQRVVLAFGLEDWSPSQVDALLSRAQAAFPADYATIATVEGLSDITIARAHKQALDEGDAGEKLRAAELHHKLAGRMKDDKKSEALAALEALADLADKIGAPRNDGGRAHSFTEPAVVDVKVLGDD